MDEFTRAYLETALWSSSDERREDGGDPIDNNYSIEDISPDTVEAARVDCDSFRAAAGKRLEERGESYAAHDFWLTRNGHGAGFWDGDWPHGGEFLTDLCKEFGACHLYVSDDGIIYHFNERAGR
jgi:hypothetical protein